MYRESHLVMDWVELNFECSIVCPIMPGPMGTWQKRLSSWTRWRNTEIKVNPSKVRDVTDHSVLYRIIV